MVALVVLLDRFCTLVQMLQFVGLIYLVAIVWIACWAGLRSALGSSAVIVAYLWVVYHYPISAIGRETAKANREILSAAITFPLIAVIAAVIQNKLRAAAIREFEARAVAEAESAQRRIAEAELWASEEMRRFIVDSSVDALIGMGSDGRITMWNPNAEKLFGWTAQEAIGSLLGEKIIPPEHRESHRAGLSRFLETGAGPVIRNLTELTALTKSGEEIDVELYVADQRTESGPVFIGFVRDISERKRAEQAIQDLNTGLEERVAERTAQLEAANSELVGFTYSVSHDLRAPLRAIVSNSRIVCEEARDSLSEESFDRLKRLELSALKMAEIIENLLKFARIGQIDLNLTEVDLTAMAEEIAVDLRTHKEGSILVQKGMIVHGDPEMIKMVLFNLMENAWKYTKPGRSPEVEVGSTSDRVFYVRDKGVGFDMQYVHKIWEPFERLHLDSQYPGTGIGLANSKRIITRHGGKVWAESAPDEGTTIYFRLDGKRPREAHGRSRHAS